MQIIRIIAAIFVCSFALFTGASASRADDCEDTIARHMVGEALLVAHFVALAEKQGMTTGEIDSILKSIAEKSAIQEFWITNSLGHAYLTNTGIDFTFSPDPTKQPQASAFWPLINGNKDIVIQAARSRLCRSHPEGREAERSSGAGADQVRTGDQPENRQGAGSHRAPTDARTRRRRGRIAGRCR